MKDEILTLTIIVIFDQHCLLNSQSCQKYNDQPTGCCLHNIFFQKKPRFLTYYLTSCFLWNQVKSVCQLSTFIFDPS